MSFLLKSHHLTYHHLNKKMIFQKNSLSLKFRQFKNRSKNLNQTKKSKCNKNPQPKYYKTQEKKFVRQDLNELMKQKLYNVCYHQLKPMKMKKKIRNNNYFSRVIMLKGVQLINGVLFSMLKWTLTIRLLLSTVISQLKKQK